MKRTPLKRKTPLTPKKEIRRSSFKTKSTSVQKKESRLMYRASLYPGLRISFQPRQSDPEYLEWIRNKPCILRGRKDHICFSYGSLNQTRSDPCHIKTRATFGPDHGNVFPGCRIAHDLQEKRTKQFEIEWKIDLTEIAKNLFKEYQQERLKQQ